MCGICAFLKSSMLLKYNMLNDLFHTAYTYQRKLDLISSNGCHYPMIYIKHVHSVSNVVLSQSSFISTKISYFNYAIGSQRRAVFCLYYKNAKFELLVPFYLSHCLQNPLQHGTSRYKFSLLPEFVEVIEQYKTSASFRIKSDNF